MNKLISDLIDELDKKNKDKHPIVCIPDGEDERIYEAITYLKNMDIVLLGNTTIIDEKIKHYVIDSSVNVISLAPQVYPSLIETIVSETKTYKKPLEYDTLVEWSINAPQFSMMLLKAHYVDCVVGGSIYPTKAILSPMLKLIRAKNEGQIVSSYMLLTKGEELLVFSDCALNINYDVDSYINLIYDTYHSVKKLGIKPNIGLLSYSTYGSGAGDNVDFINKALSKFSQLYPELADNVHGELQFDAAYNLDVRRKKCSDQNQEPINTFIFPDLNSGNIGYKIAQYLGGYQAIGPIIQGISQPVNDLSRGASSEEIAQVIYLTIANI